jgi:NADPH-dependent curcumin reductase CurA
MTTPMNLQVQLASRPHGWPTQDNFRIVESAMAPIGDGQLLVRSHYLSLDPYMRGRMSDAPSYVKPVEVGAVMCGEAVGEVLASKHARYEAGDFVYGDLGWQQFALANGDQVRKVDPRVPLAAQLSVLGMPGVTAWCGLLQIGQPKPGETVVVSGAAGAVGSIVGQIAKLKGCRAVGIAGGPEKCHYVVEDLGFDACIDYKAGNLRQELKAAAPRGVDV